VLWSDFFGHRCLVRAVWHGMGTARVKATASGRIEGARDLASEGQLLTLFVGMRRQGGGKQGLCIRVQGMGTQFEAVGKFDDLAEVHDSNTVPDGRHGGQIMASILTQGNIISILLEILGGSWR
jgi:hypothetical protein